VGRRLRKAGRLIGVSARHTPQQNHPLRRLKRGDRPIRLVWTGVLRVEIRRQRDLGALALVIGVLAVLLVTSIALGSPGIR